VNQVTSASLRYPLSVFNQNSTLKAIYENLDVNLDAQDHHARVRVYLVTTNHDLHSFLHCDPPQWLLRPSATWSTPLPPSASFSWPRACLLISQTRPTPHRLTPCSRRSTHPAIPSMQGPCRWRLCCVTCTRQLKKHRRLRFLDMCRPLRLLHPAPVYRAGHCHVGGRCHSQGFHPGSGCRQ